MQNRPYDSPLFPQFHMIHILRIVLASYLLLSTGVAHAYIPRQSGTMQSSAASINASEATYTPIAVPSMQVEATMTRSQAVAMVVAVQYSQEDLDTCFRSISPNFDGDFHLLFRDVSIEHPHAKFLCIALRDGLIHGYADGSFRPDDAITFAEAAVITSRGFVLAPFAHLETLAPWYAPHVFQLAARGSVPPSIHSLMQFPNVADIQEMIRRLQTGETWLPARSYDELAGSASTPRTSNNASSVSSVPSDASGMSSSMSSSVSSAVSAQSASTLSVQSSAKSSQVSQSYTSQSSSETSDTSSTSSASSTLSASSIQQSSEAWWEQY